MLDKASFGKAYSIILPLEGNWGVPEYETYRGINTYYNGDKTVFWNGIHDVKKRLLDKYQAKDKKFGIGYFQTDSGREDYQKNIKYWNNWILNTSGMVEKLNKEISSYSKVDLNEMAKDIANDYWNFINASDLSDQNLATNLFDQRFNGGLGGYEAILIPIFSKYGIKTKISDKNSPEINRRLNNIIKGKDKDKNLKDINHIIAVARFEKYSSIAFWHPSKIKFLPNWFDRVGIVTLHWKNPEIEDFLKRLKELKIGIPKINKNISIKYIEFKIKKIKYPKILMGLDIDFLKLEKNLMSGEIKSNINLNINISTKMEFPDIPKKLNEGIEATKDSAKNSAVASVAAPAQKLTGDAVGDAANLASAVLTNKPTSGLMRSTLINSAGAAAIEGAAMCARGGLVTRPTLAMIAEAGQSEAVIPLSNLRTDPSRSTPDMEIGTYAAHFPGVKALPGKPAQTRTSATVQYLLEQQHANRRTGMRNS